MKPLLFTFLACLGLLLPAAAQTPAPKPKPPVETKLTSHDIRVLPFAQEHRDVKFKATSREFPSELTVTTSDKIHFYGKRRSDAAPMARGKPTGHIGQVALMPPGDRQGSLVLKKAFGTTMYFAVLELPDDTLSSKQMELKEGKTYSWSVKSENGTTTLRVASADGIEMAVNHAPSDKVLGVGFAGTVRNQGNEIDMTITYDQGKDPKP